MTLLRVNIPHSSSIPNPRCVVFDHSRKIWAQLSITSEIMELMHHEFHIYVEGSVDLTGNEPVLKVVHEVKLTKEQEEAFMQIGISLDEAPPIRE